jgi:putative peptidoglycan lipid II flippase
MLIKVLAPGYYSRQDTKTPVRYGIVAMVTNMVFNAIFAYFYGYIGLAMATALSALVNMGLLYRGLHITRVYRVSRQTLTFVFRLFVAGGVMVVAVLWQLEAMPVWLNWSLTERVMSLALLIGFGGLVYVLTAVALGVRIHHLKAD